MNPRFRQALQEFSFLLVLMLGFYAITQAQTSHTAKDVKQKTVRVEVEVTENGKTTTSIQEMSFDDNEVHDKLEDMVKEIELILDEAVRDVDQTDLEIIIRKNSYGSTANENQVPHYRNFISVIPEAPVNWDVEEQNFGFLGVYAQGLTDSELDSIDARKAVRINGVVSESPAEKAGLKEGDIVLKVQGLAVGSFGELAQIVRSNKPGQTVEIDVLRQDKPVKIDAVVGQRMDRGQMERNLDKHIYRYEYEFEDDEEFASTKPFLGIVGRTAVEGVIISKVFEGTAAQKMGLQSGDVVTKLDGKNIDELDELVDHIASLEIGDELKVDYLRDGKKLKASGALNSRAEHKSQIRNHGNHAGSNEKRIVMRLKIQDLEPSEISELSDKTGSSLDVNNALELNEISFSPNPTNGQFKLTIDLPNVGHVEIKVFDAMGQTLYVDELSEFSGIYSNHYDLSNESSGIYFVSIMQEGKGKTIRVVKQ